MGYIGGIGICQVDVNHTMQHGIRFSSGVSGNYVTIEGGGINTL